MSTLEGFPIKKVVCGYNHTAALSEEGYVFTWGMGGSMWNAGALGHGDKEHQPTPVVIDYFYDNVRMWLYFESRVSQLKIYLRAVTLCWHFPIRENYIPGDEGNMYILGDQIN